jgi:WD40 repeat protein
MEGDVVDPALDGERREGSAAQPCDPQGTVMRAGVSSRVRRTVREGSRRWTATGLLALLSASALTPLLAVGAGEGALAVVASVGANVLTDVVKSGVAKIRGTSAAQQEIEPELEQRIRDILEGGGREAELLRAEIADLIREFGLVGAAIDAAVATGDRALQVTLAEGLGGLGERFEEFGFVLSDVAEQLRLIREDADRQRADLQVTVGLQYRQATDTRLLLEKLSLLERRIAPGGIGPATGVTRWEDRSPYQGLAPYGEGDAEVFAGREVIIAELVSTLSQRMVGSGLLVVTGASGAGKSSLLRAGLLPSIARGELSEPARDWPRHVIDQPTASPLARFAVLLAGLARLDAPTVLAALQRDPKNAVLLVRQAVDHDARQREVSGQGRLVLILDQFEEIFDDDVPGDQRTVLIAALSAAAAASAALIVIAVRGDFIDRCAAHPELAGALREGPFVVGPMAETDLRAAITAPADVAGLELEPGLADTILAELRSSTEGYGVGSLPLLSQTMLTVWEHREGNRLTTRGYRLTGGVTRAVATSAEAAYKSLDDARRQVARQVFQQLTTVMEDGRLARRTVARTDLQGEDVLEVFARRRLVVVDAESVQIAHDALLHHWPRLRGWLEADLTGHALRSQLLDDAEDWQSNGRTSAYLYRAERLTAIQRVVRPGTPLPGTAREFLDASAQAESRRKGVRRLVLASLSTLLVLALAATGVALAQREEAQTQQRAAVARLLVTQAEALRDADPRRALQLGIAADRIHSDSQTRASLVGTLTRTKYAGSFSAADGSVRLAFSPVSRMLATVGRYDKTLPESVERRFVVTLWSVPDRGTPRRLGTPVDMRGNSDILAFSPDGRLLVTGAERDSAVTLWNVADPLRPVRVGICDLGEYRYVRSLATSPDGRTLAIGDQDGSLTLWNIADPARPKGIGMPLAGLKDAVDSVAFSSDGRIVAAGGDEGVVLWDVKDPAKPRRLGGPLAGRSPVAFAPDRPLLATHLKDRSPTNQNAFVLWDLRDPGVVRRIGTSLSGNNASIAFSPTGDLAATIRFDGTTVLWDVTDPARPVVWGTPMGGHTGLALYAAFSTDGRTLATSSYDTTVILRDLSDARRLTRRWPVLPVDSVAFRPDGRAVASGVTSRTAALWGLADPARPAVHNIGVPAVITQLSPDGRLLATAGQDARTTVWDVSDPARPIRRTSVTGFPFLFSPDNRMLITGDNDASILWDLSDPAHPLRRTDKLPARLVLIAAFSPDSRTLAAAHLYGSYGDVTLYDLSEAQASEWPVKIRTGSSANVTALRFSPNGRMLATGRSDGKVLLWDLSARSAPTRVGQPLIAVTEDPEGNTHAMISKVSVTALAFSSDGRMMAAAGKASLALWDLSNPSVAKDLAPPQPLPDVGGVRSLEFALGDGAIVTAAFEARATLWDLSSVIGLQRHAVGRACAVVEEGLDRVAWARFVEALPYRETC